MKKISFLIIAFAGLLLASCKQEAPVMPVIGNSGIGGTTNNGGAGTNNGGTTGNTGGTSTTGTPVTGNTYLPFTAGTYWKYKDPTGFNTDVSTLTVTSTTKVVNGKTFYLFKAQSGTDAPEDTFYGYNNHIYSIYSADETFGFDYELPILDDRGDVNFSWNSTFSPPASSTAGITLNFRTVTTIKEKGITKTVGGKTFSDVIHTQVQLQIQAGSNYTTTDITDFYLAKNVGIISIGYSSPSLPTALGSTDLFEYAIK